MLSPSDTAPGHRQPEMMYDAGGFHIDYLERLCRRALIPPRAPLASITAGVLSVRSQTDATNGVELEVAMLGRIAGVAGVAFVVMVLPSRGWPQDTVKKVPMRAIASVGGKDVYKAYCAHCHGDDLKGHGPAAAGLAVPPTDLTTIALRNNGTFSPGAVEASINGWERVPRTLREVVERQQAKDARQDGEQPNAMPAFGPLLARLYPQEVRDRQVRLSNLVSYIKSQQVKSPPQNDER